MAYCFLKNFCLANKNKNQTVKQTNVSHHFVVSRNSKRNFQIILLQNCCFTSKRFESKSDCFVCILCSCIILGGFKRFKITTLMSHAQIWRSICSWFSSKHFNILKFSKSCFLKGLKQCHLGFYPVLETCFDALPRFLSTLSWVFCCVIACF